MNRIALFLLTLFSFQAAAQKTISVYFDHDVYNAFDEQALIKMLSEVKESKELRILGYTDHLGSDAYNQALSSNRANTVKNWLIENDVDKKKIVSVTAKGEISGGGEKEGTPANRRVDVILIPHPPEKVVEEIAVEPENEQVKPSPPVNENVFEIDTLELKNIVLEGLSFYGGKHYPLPASMPVLEKLYETMVAYPTLEIEIQGFICCNYEDPDGIDQDTGEPFLSYNRAKYVYTYLIDKGIAAERMRYKGYGSKRPKIYPEITEYDQQANRRVEIEIIGF